MLVTGQVCIRMDLIQNSFGKFVVASVAYELEASLRRHGLALLGRENSALRKGMNVKASGQGPREPSTTYEWCWIATLHTDLKTPRVNTDLTTNMKSLQNFPFPVPVTLKSGCANCFSFTCYCSMHFWSHLDGIFCWKNCLCSRFKGVVKRGLGRF